MLWRHSAFLDAKQPNKIICFDLTFHPLPIDHDYLNTSFYPVLLVDQITDIGNEMVV